MNLNINFCNEVYQDMNYVRFKIFKNLKVLLCRPGHSVLTEPIGSVLRFLKKFGSSKTGTVRFFSRLGTEKFRVRFFRFGFG